MKIDRILLFTLFLVMIFLTSCINDTSSESRISIQQGIAGNVIYMQGNYQPIVVSGPEDLKDIDNRASSSPLITTVYLYKLTTTDDIRYSDTSHQFIDSIGTKLLNETTSDENGFYQIDVPLAGQYSIFAIYDGKPFINYWSSCGAINKVTVSADSILIHEIDIDHNTCWEFYQK